MIRTVVLHPDPFLSQPCRPVAAADDIVELARDMLDTMYAAPGRGLAAPQIGVGLRLFVMDCTWKEGIPDPRVFVNPTLTEATGVQVNEEGCLSIPDTPRRVRRAAQITLSFDTPDGRRSERFAGFAAACVQHEVDHLDGILILDHDAA